MRPAGEIRIALLDAVTDAPGSTLQELALRAQVAVDAARRTLDNLRRAGVVMRGEDRAVAYRNKPVATYMPHAKAVAANDSISLATAMRAWG
jgi:DNA-binding IclR family transcriptional regulator